MAKVTIDGVRYELLKRTFTARVDAVEREYKNMKSYTIPEKVTADGDTYRVTLIGAKAFNNCPLLEEVIIPDSVTEIESQEQFGGIGNTIYSAFRNCTSLKSITLPNKLTRIGGGAFRNCTGLTSVSIPNSVKTLGSYAFNNCTGLTSITIPNSVTYLDGFHRCTGLTSVIIENEEGAVKISEYAFKDTNAKITYVGKPKDGAEKIVRIMVEVPTLLALLEGKASEQEVQTLCLRVKDAGGDATEMEKRLKKYISK